MIVLYIVLGLVVIVGLFIAANYNKLVVLRNRVKDQWAQVDVQLKRRSDLIPNLVETVKGYAKHESSTFEQVIKARNNFVNAKTPEDEMKASNELSGMIGRLFAIAEAYPELKANQNFLDLQLQLKEVEDKIAYARQFYNDTVLSYNNVVEMFPSNIIAGMFKFEKSNFFEIDEESKKVPEVKF